MPKLQAKMFGKFKAHEWQNKIKKNSLMQLSGNTVGLGGGYWLVQSISSSTLVLTCRYLNN